MDTLLLDETDTEAGPALTSDLAYIRLLLVNVFFVGERHAGDRKWVLVDAGLHGTASRIAEAAAERFGEDSRPAAIILTHGHFDHIGALADLARRWDAPVYAHRLEMPYLTGRSAYPPPDPTVGGGAMALLSPLYPSGPFDFRGMVRALPEDNTVPGLPDWRWIHTPGHAPGHVSLFRERDRALIAGDAFVTTRQESAIAVITQRPEMHGPPAYFTPDWRSARRSVEMLARLRPAIVATGHGRPLSGEGVRESLDQLAAEFDEVAVPRRGRYVGRPAVMDDRGTVSVPPSAGNPLARAAVGAAVALALVLALRKMRRQRA